MKPILFHIGDIPVYPFFFTIMLGALMATFVHARMCKNSGLSSVIAIDMGIIAIVASIIGSRVFHILFEYPGYYWEHPLRVFDFLSGGFVSLGAYILTAVAWIYYFRYRKIPILPYLDNIARAVPIIIFAVRLGCLLAGCCYGRPTDFWLHLVFPPGSTAYYFHQDTPLHASQVYFMVNAVVLFFVLQLVWRRRTFTGQVLSTFLIWMGVARFFIEFTRGDVDRGIYFEWLVPGYGLSTGQIVMVGFTIVGVLLYRRCQRLGPRDGT